MGERLTERQLAMLERGAVAAGNARVLALVAEVRASRASPPPCSCTCHVGACTSCGCECRASPPPDPARLDRAEVSKRLDALLDAHEEAVNALATSMEEAKGELARALDARAALLDYVCGKDGADG